MPTHENSIKINKCLLSKPLKPKQNLHHNLFSFLVKGLVMPSTCVRIIKTINRIILASNTTVSSVSYDSHLSTLLRLSRENLNLPVSFFNIFD